MADGIAVAKPGELPFQILSEHLDEIVTVGEDDLSRAVLQLLERTKLLVEPAGAAAVAALLSYPELFAQDRCVVPILSGGNIDPALLLQVIRHGMSSAGRYLLMRVRMPDRPGEIAAVLAEVAACHINLLDIVHERLASTLETGEVQVALQLEIRSEAEHEALRHRLHLLGYAVDEQPCSDALYHRRRA
jgi:threonine dehydratase